MIRPDRWNERCPHTSEMTLLELFDFLSVAERGPEVFNEWEREFCKSCHTRIRNRQKLTEKQIAALNGKLLRKLWDNDPDLWKE